MKEEEYLEPSLRLINFKPLSKGDTSMCSCIVFYSKDNKNVQKKKKKYA